MRCRSVSILNWQTVTVAYVHGPVVGTPPPGEGDLAVTGGTIGAGLVGIALLALASGAVLIMRRRRMS